MEISPCVQMDIKERRKTEGNRLLLVSVGYRVRTLGTHTKYIQKVTTKTVSVVLADRQVSPVIGSCRELYKL